MSSKLGIILFFAVCLFFFSIGNYYNSDEGVILNGAWRMYNGDQLYTDFFSFIAPASFWWTELSFKLFGPSYFSARIFSVLLLALSIIAIYQITLFAGGSKFAALFGALMWFLGNIQNMVIINHNNHSSYFASIGVLFVMLALSLNSTTYFFLAGLFVGITTIFLQTKGLALAFGFGGLILGYVFAAKINAKSSIIFFGGCLTVPAAVFLIWDPIFLYETLIRWPQEHYLEINKVSYAGWFIVTGSFLAVSFFLFKMRRSINIKAVLILAFTQFFMMLAALTRPDLSHIFLASFGLVVLSVLALEKYLPIIVEFFGASQNIFKNLSIAALFLTVFYASLTFGAQAVGAESDFRSLLQGKRFSKIYAHPFLPGIYFELRLPSPYFYDFLLTGMYPENAFMENFLKLKLENPEHIFVDYEMVQKFGYNKANALDSYIDGNYEAANDFGALKVLRRK